MTTSTNYSNTAACGFAAPACSHAGAVKWNVVWCHEWIHKEELNEKRRSITKAVEEAGAALHCLKKATTFEKWILKQDGTEPYVLLTNWRLTKPCLDIFQRIPQAQLPTLTVIHCESASCFPPAALWAQQNHASTIGRVHVSDSLDLEDSLFAKGYFGGLSKLFQLPVNEAPSSDSFRSVASPVPECGTEPLSCRTYASQTPPATRHHSGFSAASYVITAAACSSVVSPPSSASSCSTSPSFHPDQAPIVHCFDQFAAHRDQFAAAAHLAAASAQHITMNDPGLNSQECYSASISDGLELAHGVAAQTKEWSSWDTLMQCTDVKAVVFSAACQALQPVYNYCTAKEIEAILVQAMPDHYDD